MKIVTAKKILKANDQLAQEIRGRFADLLSCGTFRQTAALPEEKEDTRLAHLRRLVFHFNRRDQGRLRQLIDYLNGF